jgi:hypothetical protein
MLFSFWRLRFQLSGILINFKAAGGLAERKLKFGPDIWYSLKSIYENPNLCLSTC